MIHTFYFEAPVKPHVLNKLRELNLNIVEIDFDSVMGYLTGNVKVDVTGRTFEVEQFRAFNEQFVNMGL